MSPAPAITAQPLASTPGVWGRAWRVMRARWSARLALAWIGTVVACAVLAPIISSGHPISGVSAGASDVTTRSQGAAFLPIIRFLSKIDVLLLVLALLWSLMLLLRWAVIRCSPAGIVLDRLRPVARWCWLVAVFLAVAAAIAHPSPPALQSFARYAHAADSPQAYTLNPWSPGETSPERALRPPGSPASVGTHSVSGTGTTTDTRRLWLGSDLIGRDVLAVMLHACRLSIGVGVVSTGLAIAIGVLVGAAMGYFGGWVDAVLMRVLEVFMSVPMLLLVVAAASVLPRDLPPDLYVYVLMAVIGCCSWMGAARFTRAEFLRLRELDWVASARAAGVPTLSIVTRHILPAAVTPVLVEASFAAASAILAESALAYLGLVPIAQPSWGRLLDDAIGSGGEVRWWLGAFPGGAIFLTVLATNVIGQNLREAMNPKDQV